MPEVESDFDNSLLEVTNKQPMRMSNAPPGQGEYSMIEFTQPAQTTVPSVQKTENQIMAKAKAKQSINRAKPYREAEKNVQSNFFKDERQKS